MPEVLSLDTCLLVDCVGVSSGIEEVEEPIVRFRERIVTVGGT